MTIDDPQVPGTNDQVYDSDRLGTITVRVYGKLNHGPTTCTLEPHLVETPQWQLLDTPTVCTVDTFCTLNYTH